MSNPLEVNVLFLNSNSRYRRHVYENLLETFMEVCMAHGVYASVGYGVMDLRNWRGGGVGAIDVDVVADAVGDFQINPYFSNRMSIAKRIKHLQKTRREFLEVLEKFIKKTVCDASK